MPAPEQNGLSGAGKFLMIWFSVLFGWEVIAPYFIQVGVTVGDANTKAVLANLCIAIMAYLLGRNEGSRQADQTISKLVDTAKQAQDVIAANVPTSDVTQLKPSEIVQAPAATDATEKESKP